MQKLFLLTWGQDRCRKVFLCIREPWDCGHFVPQSLRSKSLRSILRSLRSKKQSLRSTNSHFVPRSGHFVPQTNSWKLQSSQNELPLEHNSEYNSPIQNTHLNIRPNLLCDHLWQADLMRTYLFASTERNCQLHFVWYHLMRSRITAVKTLQPPRL